MYTPSVGDVINYFSAPGATAVDCKVVHVVNDTTVNVQEGADGSGPGHNRVPVIQFTDPQPASGQFCQPKS